jgi:hypothetical protein
MRTRSSIADGWGVLTTPFGIFNTIRVKSVLIQDDSVHLDSLGVNIPLYREITQYKWLANGEGIPVLQVNVELGMISAIYRDIYRPGVNPLTVSLGPDTAVFKNQSITLTPQVTNGVPPYRFIWSTFDTTSSVTLIIDTTIQAGVIVFDALNNMAMDFITISVKYPPWIEESTAGKLQVSPNPNNGDFAVILPDGIRNGILTITDMNGKRVHTRNFDNAREKIQLSDTGLIPGSYTVSLLSGPSRFYSVIIVR